MKKTMMMALALAGTLTAGSASAADYVTGGLAQSYMTYTTVGQVSSSRTSAYSGVGSLFVSTVSTATTGLGGLCTGSLIGSGTVLTAAHCLEANPNDPITSIAFSLPSFERVCGQSGL
jgi:V8-like Glu-specific endopeptidase